MLTIYLPDSYRQEREYILNVIFSCFLGIDYTVVFGTEKGKVILKGKKGSIKMEDILFSLKETDWLSNKCLPKEPLKRAFFTEHQVFGGEDIPVLFGESIDGDKYLDIQNEFVYLGIDILGSAFFMLTRMEEYILRDRDEHDRFPVESSIAYKAGFLDCPIINEYLELLWGLLKYIEPSLEMKKRQYKVLPTHDIDKPFGMMFDDPLQVVRHCAGDIIFRKSAHALWNRVQEIFQLYFRKKQYITQKSETFAFIDSESRKHNLKDVFFFMNSKKSWYDGNYTVDEPYVLNLIARLFSQGHCVGLHPSFESYLDGEEIKSEVDLMNEVFAKNHFPSLCGARQHYLKWKNPDTWQYYEVAGIPFDSSMTYAGHVGFRCGVCYPFPVFNLETRKQLKLVEHPLIVMDATLYKYMGLSHDEAMSVVRKLANECKKYNGEFVILWHNTMLDDVNEREFYSKMLDEVCCE